MTGILGAVRRIPAIWQKGLAVVGVYVVCEVGARITLPGLNGSVLTHFLRTDWPTGLLSLYDRFVGGALSRGALLALGVMPYISARIMIRLLRLAVPIVEELWREDPERVNRWTRALTISLSLIQSFGFAMMVQGIPGAVKNPGYGFTVSTMSVLTAGAIITMELAERITRHDDDDELDELAGQPVMSSSGDGAPISLAAGDVTPQPQRASDLRERVL